MKRNRHALAVPALLLLVGAAQPARSETQQIEGVGLSRDIHCEGGDVGVYGADNAVRLTGTCANVVVHGSDHTVALERGAQLAVSGIGQRVTGGEVSGLSVEGTQSVVSVSLQSSGADAVAEISGAEQKVALRLGGPSRLAIQGYQHEIGWSAGRGVAKPRISAAGIASRIVETK
ncbi:DUF3060 domain-containing protein [Methylobacterium sp. Leaf118]|uniref:DUF3060 domain-containing protein n=1 Tax=Methylobacterium sp. Leaf118 TaxID=2876562 RepID=UPI001E45EAD4|nr:DUF3060 domain-containing protein [Methylobacterium sp. Leaf118]